MADDPQGFDENFGFLRGNGVIPPNYPTAAVPDEVKVMIANLSQEEMDRLRDTCEQTQSFLYLDLHGKLGPAGIICAF